MLNLAARKRRAAEISAYLTDLYPDPPIPLHHRDAYTLLIAVLLSAQCTDKRVNEVTPRLFQLAATPAEMAKQSATAVLDIIRPCGLGPQKSHAIVELSKILIERFSSNVPEKLSDLESLPGVGRKTAQVVVAQSFGIPAFPVDTHIHRLAKRWKLSNGRSVLQTERDLKAVFPPEIWNKLHLQMIYYGREYCTARGCDAGLSDRSCPLCQRF